ncbi:UbiA family prenyltransferase [Prosthecochloris sp. SCSIO W1101]|uniref:UbiA family prenyltransferase n=1 Tax=Prosthecochloris sp. SCSIO W1101 TaxID=2992242 RepID=UPI00223D5FFD|nr:UbiA family prenyltransferase [Prosthecochloris sp. SCSIO W1101]UZJ40443.1 UbiA family prenyltransferase [Prosthecochloris sp. SCSIO W1101]
MTVTKRSGFIDKAKAHLELLDPVTWISAFPCLAGGVMASGAMQSSVHDYLLLFLLFIIWGPLGIGFSQSVNDYFDLELDKVNEPTRPIPSGRLTEKEAIWNWSIVLLLAILIGSWIGVHIGGQRGFIFTSCLFIALIFGYIYSAPPLKLKKNIFFSAPAVGLCYGFVTYLSANALFGEIRPEVIGLAGLNFFMAVALIIMNDFKSQDGDAKSGMKSLTVMIGSRNTFLVAFLIIDLVFAVFAILAWTWGFHILMYIILASLAVNIFIQIPIYRDPKTGASFMQNAVDDGFGNAIGKSEVQEHNAFLRFQVVNNILFLVNQFSAAALIGLKYL